MRKIRRSALLFTILLTLSDKCWADDARPTPILRTPNQKNIKDLIVSSEITIENKIDGENVVSYARVKGVYPVSYSSLISSTQRATQTEDGKFELPIQITGASTVFDLTMIDPYGNAQKDRYQIDIPGWAKYTNDLQSQRKNELGGNPNPFSISLGLSNIFYSETSNIDSTVVGDYTSTVVTAKANYVKPSPFPRWNIGFGTFLTVIPLQESSSASARFWGVNARIGYSLIPNSPVWKAGIYGGVYYTTMFVKNDQFGFSGMTGPQIFPVVKKILGAGRSISVYLKYAALVSNASVISFGSREIATGGEFIFLYNRGHSQGLASA